MQHPPAGNVCKTSVSDMSSEAYKQIQRLKKQPHGHASHWQHEPVLNGMTNMRHIWRVLHDEQCALRLEEAHMVDLKSTCNKQTPN
jgi:hypothetical protein